MAHTHSCARTSQINSFGGGAPGSSHSDADTKEVARERVDAGVWRLERGANAPRRQKGLIDGG